MKYDQFEEEDFILDDYFQKWVLDNDAMAQNFWKNWLKDRPEKVAVITRAREYVYLLAKDNDSLSDASFDAMWQNIVQKRSDLPTAIPALSYQANKSVWSTLLRVAAVFIGLIGTVAFLHFVGAFDRVTMVYPNEVTLELQDGSLRPLDETDVEIIEDENGDGLVNHQKTKLNYKAVAQVGKKKTAELAYNTLSVPYGKKFELELSDGTVVHLNSGSSLRYPVAFLADKPRRVFLDGEAYFSVEKDSLRTFTVVTDELNTEVYGTEFNVSSYKNENNTSTVLVEGSVGVYTANKGLGQKVVTIVPGQRAVMEKGAIAVDRVNVAKYTAWVKGGLFFAEDRFDLIIKELERHYDIEIDNQYAALNKERFTGSFTDETLDKIFRVFGEHTPFDYHIKGRDVILTRKGVAPN